MFGHSLLLAAAVFGAADEADSERLIRAAVESRLSAIHSAEIRCTVVVDRREYLKKFSNAPAETRMQGVWRQSGELYFYFWETVDEDLNLIVTWSFDGQREYSQSRRVRVTPETPPPQLRINGRTDRTPIYTPSAGTGQHLIFVPLSLLDLVRQDATTLTRSRSDQGRVEFVSRTPSTQGGPLLVRSWFDKSRGFALQGYKLVLDPDDPGNQERFKTIPTDRDWAIEMSVEEWIDVKPGDSGATLHFPRRFVMRQSGGIDYRLMNDEIQLNGPIDPTRFVVHPPDGTLVSESKDGRLVRSGITGDARTVDRTIQKITEQSKKDLDARRGGPDRAVVDARPPGWSPLQRFFVALAVACFAVCAIHFLWRRTRAS